MHIQYNSSVFLSVARSFAQVQGAPDCVLGALQVTWLPRWAKHPPWRLWCGGICLEEILRGQGCGGSFFSDISWYYVLWRECVCCTVAQCVCVCTCVLLVSAPSCDFHPLHAFQAPLSPPFGWSAACFHSFRKCWLTHSGPSAWVLVYLFTSLLVSLWLGLVVCPLGLPPLWRQ